MAALPSLRQLSYLVTLSETLHFTEAARRSFVTQSTLSGGIMELERLLGGVLVERDRQNVRLTPRVNRWSHERVYCWPMLRI